MKRKWQASASNMLKIIGIAGACLLVGACSKSSQPPAPEQAKSPKAAAVQPAAQLPNEEQIKNDLFKATIKLAGNKLETFDKIENFKEIKIVGENRQGDALEYKVNIVYNDTTYGTFDKIEATIQYKQEQGKWKLASATGKLL